MAINKKLIHFQKKENFENEVANGNILDNSIVFIKDTKEIWTHGTYYGGDKLTTARKIGITGGAVGTGTNFDGSASINIPVTTLYDTPLEYKTLSDRNTEAQGLTLIDAVTGQFTANRLAFKRPENILIEYSNDGGVNWNISSHTDETKVKLVSGIGANLYLGNKTTGQTIQDKLRITIFAAKDGLDFYSTWQRLYVYLGTNGAKGLHCTYEYSLRDTPDNWVSQGDWRMVGWSGWNKLSYAGGTSFGGKNSSAHPFAIRLTFWFVGHVDGYENKTSTCIYKLELRGTTVYNNFTGCKLAETGHMYDYDWQKNVTFPAAITATKLITTGGTSDQVVLGDGTLKPLSEIGSKTYSVATPDSDGLMSKEDKIKSDLFEYSKEENSLDCNAKISPAGVEVNNSSETLESKLQLTKSEFTGTEDLCLDITSTNTIPELPAPIVGRIAVSPGAIGSARFFSFDDGENKEEITSGLFIDNSLSLDKGGIYSKITNKVEYESTIGNHTSCVDIDSDHYSSSLSIFTEEGRETGEYRKGEILVNASGDDAKISLWYNNENTSAGIHFSAAPEIRLVKDAQTEVLIGTTGITAPRFITKGGTANQVVLGDGSVKEISEVGKSYSIATTSEDGLMSKGMYSALKDGFIANIVEVTTYGNSVELSYDAAYPNGDGTFNMMEGEGVEIPLATTTSAGVMSKEDKIKLDSLSTSTDGGMTISGTVNLTNGTFNTQNNSSLNSYTKVFNSMSVGEMRMYLVADSSGNLPSTSETAVTVPHDGILSPAQVYFGKSQAFGVSVGDICVLFKKSSLLNICRIIPLNDVKPSNGDFPGADGLATVWDKNRINKIDGIEWTANHVRDTYLPKSDRFPSRADWLINVDYCIDNGVYPTCDTASMNVGWTNQYVTLIVQRTSTADNGGYNTVEQTAYGRGSDEGRIYKRIIFVKSDDSDVQYGQWINIVSRNSAQYHTCKYGSDSMLNFIRSIKYSLIKMSNILDGTIHFNSVDDYVGVVSFFKYGDQKCKVIGQTIGSLSHNSIYETGTLQVSYSGFCGTLDLQDDNINSSDCLCATANEDTWKFNGRVN